MLKIVKAENGWKSPDDPGEPNGDGRGQPRWSVNMVEAKLLAELCRGLTVMEIGTGLGVSTITMAKRAKFIYTVDIDPWVREKIAHTLPSNVKFLDSVKDVPYDMDAAFIDGLHSYKQCSQDIKDAREHVKDGGIILFHDTHIEAVKSAIKDSHIGFIYIETPVGMGLAWNKKEI